MLVFFNVKHRNEQYHSQSRIFLFFLNNPLGQLFLFAGIIHADFDDFSSIVFVWNRIIVAVYLVDSFLCGSVHFELENVDDFLFPDNGITSAFAVLNFTDYELAHKFEDEPHESLAVKLVLFLVRLFWSRGENVIDALHKVFDFAVADFFEE